MKIERYCTCGAVLSTNVPGIKRVRVLMNWYDKHSGDGHADTTAAEAERVRMGWSVAGGREAKKAGAR